MQQLEYLKVKKSCPFVADLDDSISGTRAHTDLTLSVEKISFEEYIRFREIPECLTDLKLKAKEKKSASQEKGQQDHQATNLMGNSLLKDLAASHGPHHSIEKLMLQAVKSREQQRNQKVSAEELTNLLELGDDKGAHYYKIDIQAGSASAVLSLKVDFYSEQMYFLNYQIQLLSFDQNSSSSAQKEITGSRASQIGEKGG